MCRAVLLVRVCHIPTAWALSAATHILPQELCDGGTLTKAIHKGLFCGTKDGSPGEYHKMRAMLRTAREIARGV